MRALGIMYAWGRVADQAVATKTTIWNNRRRNRMAIVRMAAAPTAAASTSISRSIMSNSSCNSSNTPSTHTRPVALIAQSLDSIDTLPADFSILVLI